MAWGFGFGVEEATTGAWVRFECGGDGKEVAHKRDNAAPARVCIRVGFEAVASNGVDFDLESR